MNKRNYPAVIPEGSRGRGKTPVLKGKSRKNWVDSLFGYGGEIHSIKGV